MNGLVILGIILIALGAVGLLAGGVSYTKDRDTAELGPIDVTVEKKEHVAIPRPLSVAALVAGIILVVMGATRRRSA